MILRKRSLQKQHLLKLYSQEILPLLSAQVGYFSCLSYLMFFSNCLLHLLQSIRANVGMYINMYHGMYYCTFWVFEPIISYFILFSFALFLYLFSIGGIPCANDDGNQFTIKKYDKSIQQSLNLDSKFLPCSITTWRYVPLSSLIIDNYFP